MRKVKKITVWIKGEFYAQDFYDCQTLKEILQEYSIKRSQVVCWEKHY